MCESDELQFESRQRTRRPRIAAAKVEDGPRAVGGQHRVDYRRRVGEILLDVEAGAVIFGGHAANRRDRFAVKAVFHGNAQGSVLPSQL